LTEGLLPSNSKSFVFPSNLETKIYKENNNRMDLGEIGWKNVDWIFMAQDSE